jgi:hypothetical protein
MNKGQIKSKIFMIQLVDWSLYIAVVAVGAYTVLYSEHKELMAIASLAGLFLVHAFGQISLNKIAALRIDLERLKRQEHKSVTSIVN